VRSPWVIYLPAAFAALLAAYQREHLVNRRLAEKALKREDHRMQAWVRSLYGVDIDDPQRFSLVLNASCFSRDRIVELLLAAGGVQATVTAV
jgi:cytidylate kinase